MKLIIALLIISALCLIWLALTHAWRQHLKRQQEEDARFWQEHEAILREARERYGPQSEYRRQRNRTHTPSVSASSRLVSAPTGDSDSMGLLNPLSPMSPLSSYHSTPTSTPDCSPEPDRGSYSSSDSSYSSSDSSSSSSDSSCSSSSDSGSW